MIAAMAWLIAILIGLAIAGGLFQSVYDFISPMDVLMWLILALVYAMAIAGVLT